MNENDPKSLLGMMKKYPNRIITDPRLYFPPEIPTLSCGNEKEEEEDIPLEQCDLLSKETKGIVLTLAKETYGRTATGQRSRMMASVGRGQEHLLTSSEKLLTFLNSSFFNERIERAKLIVSVVQVREAIFPWLRDAEKGPKNGFSLDLVVKVEHGGVSYDGALMADVLRGFTQTKINSITDLEITYGDGRIG